MYQHNVNECAKKIKDIVIKAGNRAKKKIDSIRITCFKEKDDVVTETDLLVENIIFNYITKHFPDHGFDSEEMGNNEKESDYVWILDPIDGTKHYIKGLPLYSISLALTYKKNLVQGIVYIPETGQLFYTGKGSKEGAYINKKRIYCSREEELKNSIVCLEIPSSKSGMDSLENALEKMQVLIKETKRVRIIGVGSIGLCYCACGGFDVYLNLGSNFSYHDYAAGKIIVEQAGGEFRQMDNSLIAGNPVIVKKVVDLLELG
ncbi:MAG: hypothetical protein JXB88_00645 [Spirochaetales bacterium]|nr:hypothetical protein [Spirochaetales bacterium]